MDANELNALKRVAEKGDPVQLSSKEVGDMLGVSPQTASRYLSVLEEDGYLDRELLPRGQRLSVTDEGICRLRKEYEDYRRIFEESRETVFRGEVIQGLGEGRYYMSREGYQEQFEEVLGYRAFPGTLNLELVDGDPHPSTVLPDEVAQRIGGFEEEDRTFGAVVCYGASLEGVDCAIVVPERSHHDTSVFEVISEEKLRDELDLEDGDVVEVRVGC